MGNVWSTAPADGAADSPPADNTPANGTELEHRPITVGESAPPVRRPPERSAPLCAGALNTNINLFHKYAVYFKPLPELNILFSASAQEVESWLTNEKNARLLDIFLKESAEMYDYAVEMARILENKSRENILRIVIHAGDNINNLRNLAKLLCEKIELDKIIRALNEKIIRSESFWSDKVERLMRQWYDNSDIVFVVGREVEKVSAKIDDTVSGKLWRIVQKIGKCIIFCARIDRPMYFPDETWDLLDRLIKSTTTPVSMIDSINDGIDDILLRVALCEQRRRLASYINCN